MAGTELKHSMVIKGVVKALQQISQRFNVPIYDERMLQNFTEPCLFVIERRVNQRRELGSYFTSEHHIEVSYISKPNAETTNMICSAWRFALMAALSKISVEAYTDDDGSMVELPVRAHNPECRLVNDNVVFTAFYSIRGRQHEHGVSMQKLEHNEGIK